MKKWYCWRKLKGGPLNNPNWNHDKITTTYKDTNRGVAVNLLISLSLLKFNLLRTGDWDETGVIVFCFNTFVSTTPTLTFDCSCEQQSRLKKKWSAEKNSFVLYLWDMFACVVKFENYNTNFRDWNDYFFSYCWLVLHSYLSYYID